MTIQARYSGVCRECGERWHPGDLIRAADQPIVIGGWMAAGVWIHAVCPDPDDEVTRIEWRYLDAKPDGALL